jgi:pimeloyl-ACP methyl ester carboxylesterase
MLRMVACALLGAALTAVGALAQPAKPGHPLPAWRRDGQVVWTDTADGRIKARVYPGAHLTVRPVLVVWLHGDLGPGSEPYELTQQIAGFSDNVVAAAILRPGYDDAEGDRSAGRKGRAIGDNYTAQVVDDVHAVIEHLKTRVRPRAVIVMGHSGGAGVAANLLGRYPEEAAAAVLIACSCDPKEFMSRFAREHPGIPKGLPNPSLSPLDMAAGVSRKTRVRMVVGSADTVVLVQPSQAYAAALKRNGVDVRLAVVNGADHVSVLGTDAVHQAVAEMVAAEGGKVRAVGR